MFMMLAGMGLSILSGRGQAKAARLAAEVEATQAKTKRNNDRAQVFEGAASNRLAAHMEALNNKRLMDAAGEAFAAETSNLTRMQDLSTRGNLEQQIGASEAAGAYAANVASKGVAGSAIDMIEQGIELRAARQAADSQLNQGYQTYDQVKRAAGVLPQAVSQMATTTVMGGNDYSNAPITRAAAGPDYTQAIMNSGLLQLGGQAIQGLFGGGGGLVGPGMKPGGGLGIRETSRGSSSSFWNVSGGLGLKL